MENVRQIEDLMAEWQRRSQQGENVSVDELCSDCPELKPELTRRIAESGHRPEFSAKGCDNKDNNVDHNGESLSAGATPIWNPPFLAHGADNKGRANITVTEPPSAEQARDMLVFQQRYHKLRFLARGGLGEIFVADDLDLQRDVVLKFIGEPHRHRADCHRQFQLEAEVTAKLDHPGVVPVYGIGRTPEGHACYAMRFIDGVTLDQKIQEFHAPRTPRSDGRAIREASPFSAARTSELHSLLTQFITVCKTLAYAHNRGIVHRDIKPDNIMLGKYGETLVVDWGLAIPVDRDDSAKACGEKSLMPSSGSGSSPGGTGVPVGTPAYMSPEQAQGAAVRPASDLFSLGATLYKLLTGQAPYSGVSTEEVVRKALQGAWIPPRQFDKRIPRPLAAICEKAMASDVAKRYATALNLAADLELWLSDEPVTAYQENSSERLGRWTRQHRVWTQSILTALVVVSLVVTLAATQFSHLADMEREAHNAADEARNAAEATRKTSLQLAAEFIAKAMGQDLQSRWLILEREAAAPVLPQALKSEPINPADGDRDLQFWLSERMSQSDWIAPAKSWMVLDRQGTLRGRFPTSETIGKNFVFRDYFHGLGRDVDPNQKQDLAPLTRPHRSNIFRSQTDDSLVVTLSAPIWSGQGNERRVIGVLAMSLQIGQFGILESQLGGDRVLRLVDTNASAQNERGTVLYDSRSKNGTLAKMPQRIPDPLIDELEHLRLSRVQQERQQPATARLFKDHFTDAVDDHTSTQWIAAFEPVLLRTASGELHDTGWVVIVQQPTAAH